VATEQEKLHCWISYDFTIPQVMEKKIFLMYCPPEHCIKQWYDKPTGYVCLSKKCGLGEQ